MPVSGVAGIGPASATSPDYGNIEVGSRVIVRYNPAGPRDCEIAPDERGEEL